MAKKLVIEVRGGLVQEIYYDDNDLEIVVVDWDNKDGGAVTEPWVSTFLSRMPDETAKEVEGLTR